MPWQKEEIKYALITAIIGFLIALLITQIYFNVGEWDIKIGYLAISLGLFLGVFLVLSIIGKLKKPSFYLVLPVFLVYFAIESSIELTQIILDYNSASFPPYYTLYDLFLLWLENSPLYLAVFGLIGIASGIMMVRLASKLKYDAFYFILSSLIGVGAGLILIQLGWAFTWSAPYLALFILVGTLTVITVIQIAWVRKRQPSNLHTSISVALWIIAFIIIVFLFVWLDHILFPPQIM